MLTRILDEAMDWTILPGYTSFGYRVRERLGPWDAIELGGRSVMVTGASAGIGEAACAELARAGATVHMVVRSRERGEQARKRIAATSGSTAVELHLCDLSSLASVREFASGFLASGGTLGVLINNAGVFPVERRHTEEGFELTFATNVLGPFLLTSLLLPALAAGSTPRVITVSSGGMYTARLRAGDLELRREDYDGSRAYAHTKRIEVILNRLWADHHGSDGFLFHSMHPGWVATPGLRRSLPRFERLMRPALRSPRQGADTIVWLATAPLPRSSGGAFWHDRLPRSQHRLPGTRETESERRLLWDSCERLSAISNEAPRSAAAV